LDLQPKLKRELVDLLRTLSIKQLLTSGLVSALLLTALPAPAFSLGSGIQKVPDPEVAFELRTLSGLEANETKEQLQVALAAGLEAGVSDQGIGVSSLGAGATKPYTLTPNPFGNPSSLNPPLGNAGSFSRGYDSVLQSGLEEQTAIALEGSFSNWLYLTGTWAAIL